LHIAVLEVQIGHVLVGQKFGGEPWIKIVGDAVGVVCKVIAYTRDIYNVDWSHVSNLIDKGLFLGASIGRELNLFCSSAFF
jgi:hypothetical protein